MALVLFSLGTALQACFWLALWQASGHPPLANSFQALGLWTLIVSAVFLGFEWRWRIGLLGAFVAPLTTLTLFMGFRFAALAEQAPAAQAMPGLWLAAHVALAMAGYAAFTLAFGVALAFLLQERQLKSGKLGELFYELPSLVELERMVFVCVGWGALLLALGLAGGAAWNSVEAGRRTGLDLKTLLSLAALAFYTLVWLARRAGKLFGRRASLLVIVGWLALFFGFYLANTSGGGHGFS
jgi:ABC-type transport system involved in cytochrome c biogenesis permease subunit